MQPNDEVEADAASVETQAATSKETEIVVNNEYITTDTVSYDPETKVFSATYKRGEDDLLKGAVNNIKNSVKVKLGQEENAELKGLLTYKWQKGSPKAEATSIRDYDYSDLPGGEFPHDAGAYRYVITLAEDAELCNGATAEIYFAILPCEITPVYDNAVTAGTTVADLKKDIRENCSLKEGENGVTNLSLFIDHTATAIDIIRGYDASGTHGDGTALADTDTLRSDEDYAFKITGFTWKTEATAIKDNYTVSDEPVRLTVAENLTEVKVEAAAGLGKVYDEQPIDEADIKSKLTITVGVVEEGEDGHLVPVTDEDGKQLTVTADPANVEAFKYTWLDANEEEIENGAQGVKDAGTYYCRVTYLGEEGRYAKSSEDVRVVISKAEVYIGDITVSASVNENKAVYNSGITAGEVLKTITGYAVKNTDVAGQEAEKAWTVDEHFWGVSYNDAEKTQSYEPVFWVQKGTSTKVGETETVRWENMSADKSLEIEDNVSYRIVFSGRKAVYKDGGRNVPINEGLKNHTVDVTDGTLTAKALTIELNAAQKVEINIDALCNGEAGKTFENPNTKVYDGEQLYKNREYKNLVTLNDASMPSGAAFTYAWDTATEVLTKEDKDGKEYLDPTWSRYEANPSENKDYNNNVEVSSTPKDAGVYRLRITYNDPSHATYAVPVDVYYTIQRKNVYIKLEGTPEPYIGNEIGSFLGRIDGRLGTEDSLVQYSLWDDPEFTIQNTELNLYSDYSLEWFVERQMKDGSGKYVVCDRLDEFLEGETYRLGVWANFEERNKNYNNHWVLDVYNRKELEADGKEKTYDNGFAEIHQKVSQGIELNFTIDWSKIGDMVKTYDGQPVDKAAIIDAITVTNEKTGEEIADTSFIQYRWYWREFPYADGFLNGIYVDDAVHSGTYHFCAIVEEDDTYAEKWEHLGDDENPLLFTINPAKLIVSPVLKDEVKAGGEYTGDLKDKLDAVITADPELKIDAETPVTADQEYLAANRKYVDGTQFSYPDVFESFGLFISPKQEDKETGYLRSGIEYNVRHTGQLISGVRGVRYADGKIAFYAPDYEPEFETKSFTPVRAEAEVTKSKLCDDSTALYDEISGDAVNGYVHTITPKTGINYSSFDSIKDEDGKPIPGNYFVFRVTAPKEYTNVPDAAAKVINNIKKKNGYIVAEGTEDGRKYYEVAFDASGKDTKEFEITWEEGYAETFKVDLTKSILLEDLTRAVVPKNLAFNGASKKMAIGEEQQLDLKITKKQMADIIHIGYESTNESILTVTETGRVTAIAKGKADIIAYAAYEDEDGKTVPFKNAKGNYEKSAKLSITVNKVTEVKNIKLDVRDSSVYLDYAKPVDGYRREIYVLEGKKTADDFEAAIAAVDNGNYDAFARNPLFMTGDMDDSPYKNGKNFKYRAKITGLGYGKEYTLYVRNVSGIRTLDNGEKITLADSWAGSAKTLKTFKTTLPQDWALRTSFDTSETSPVKNAWDEEKETYLDYINISSKKVPLQVEGKYPENESWSERLDFVWRMLPHKEKTRYIEPKLTYVVAADRDEFKTESRITEQAKLKDMGMAQTGNFFYWPTSKATIDKNGKITPKDVGYIYVFAYDPLTENYDYSELKITADANVLTGKAINLKAGNKVSLSKYLTYKQDKIVLPGYGSVTDTVYSKRSLDLSCVPDAAPYFEIEPVIEEDGRIDDYTITAKQPGGNVTLTVWDKTVRANGGADVVIKLKAAAIDPVKKLKATAHYDKAAIITFDYTALRDDNLRFRLEVKDQSGKILQSKYIPYWAYESTDEKKQIDHFRYEINDIDKIVRLSSYSLTVTAVYENLESKAASARFKTTNIPANAVNDLGNKEIGGVEIGVSRIGSYLSERPLLKTGNIYVLDLRSGEEGDEDSVYTLARAMKTDTLTWKSSDRKVATVKANAGSYTATLKAVKRGFTDISVTSKITKKVIARWRVYVNAMNEAYGYYGDHIEHYYGYDEADDEISGIDVLTLGNPFGVSLKRGESKLLSFTAPSYGVYRFSGASWIREKGKKDWNPIDNPYSAEKGTKYYILVEESGTVTVTGTEYKELSADGTKVTADDNVFFIALETDYYTFTLVKDGKTAAQESRLLSEGQRFRLNVDEFFGVSGSGYTLQISRSAKLVQDTDTSVDLEAGYEKWYSFKADKAGLYTISTKDAQETITAGYQINNGGQEEIDLAKDGKNVVSDSIPLGEGDTVYIKLSSRNQAAKATLRIDRTKDIVAGTPETVTIVKDPNAEEGLDALTTETRTFIADKDGTYIFAASYTKADDLHVTFKLNGDEVSQDAYPLELKKGNLVKIEVTANKADTAVTISVTEDTPVELKVGTEEKADITAAGKEITFTALETGYYDFSFAQEDAQANVSGNYTTENTRAEEEINFTEGKASSVIYLEAGQTVTIWLSSESAAATVVKVTVTLQEIKELTASTISVKAGETLRYQWTAKNDGLYTFGSEVKSGVATISYSYTPADVEYETDSLAVLTGSYKNGDKRYITFTATEDASIEVKLAEEIVDTMVAGTPKDIELDGYASKWISFTAKTHARYRFSQADADGFNITETTELRDNGTTAPFGLSNNERVLTTGARRYYKVTNTSAEKKTIKLTISAVTAKDAVINTSVTETVKKPDRAWFKFTAAESGRYQFTAKAKQGEAEADATIASYKDIVAEDSTTLGTGSLVVLRKNEVRYLRVTTPASFNATDDITVTFTAAKKTGEAITESKALELKANEAQYLEFNVPEDGIYTVSAKSGDTDAAGVTVRCYMNLESTESTAVALPVSYQWKKDDKILLAVTSTTDQSVTVNIKKETVMPLTVGEAKSCEIQNGDALYFEVSADEASRYFVETLDVAEGLNLTVSKLSGKTNSASVGYISSGYVSYVGTPGNKVIYKVTATGAPDAKKSFKIRYGLVEAKIVKADVVDAVKELAPGRMSWYSFTPEEEGTYVVKAKGMQIYENTSGDINGSFHSYGNNLYEKVISKEEVGKELFYAVRNSGSEKKDVDFTIYKATPKELSEGSDVEVDVTKVDANENVWIHFTAPADGRYSFTTDCNGADISTVLVESSNKSIGFGLNSEICLDKDDELTFKLYYSDVTSEDFKNFKVSVTSVKADPIQAGTAKTYEGLSGSTTKWVAFTADKTATYKFELTGCNGYIYEKINSASYSTQVSSYNNTYRLVSGQTIYIRLNTHSSATTASITVSMDTEMVQLNTGIGTVPDIEGYGAKWAYFTATEAGCYSFTTDDEVAVYVYRNTNQVDSFGAGSSSSRNMDEGDSLFFSVYNRSEETASATITVEKTGDILTLTSASPLNVNKAAGQNDVWLKATAEGKGTYIISLDGSENRYSLYLYNDIDAVNNGNWSINSNNVLIVDFAQSESKYVRISGNTAEDTYTVTLTKHDAVELEGTVNRNIKLAKDETVLLKYTTYEARYTFGFSTPKNVSYVYSSGGSGNSTGNAWTINPNNECYLLLAGLEDDTTVNITAQEYTYTEGNQIGYVSFDNSSETKTVNFSRNVSGRYAISLPYGMRIANSTISGLQEYGQGSTSYPCYTCNLTAGRTYSLTIASDYGSEGDVYASLLYRATLTMDSPVNVNMNNNQETWISFTAPSDGRYNFYSADSTIDTYVVLYVNSIFRESNDDGGEGLNFGVFGIELAQGDEVLLRTYRLGHSSDSGNYTVYAELTSDEPGSDDEYEEE